jgi:hypothetical protein
MYIGLVHAYKYIELLHIYMYTFQMIDGCREKDQPKKKKDEEI